MGRPPSCMCGACDKCRRAAYMREWYQRKTPEERREWASHRNHTFVLEAKRRWAKSPSGKIVLRENTKRMRAKFPEKYKARGQVQRAIQAGRLIRQPCEVCGKAGAQAHHDDYSKPLEVRWMCEAHHRQHHREGLV